MFYRGNDNKLYSVDQTTLEKFKQDPVLNQKLDGYVARFSPTETKDLIKESVPFSDERISREGVLTGFQSEASSAQAEADRLQNLGFFGRIKEGSRVESPPSTDTKY